MESPADRRIETFGRWLADVVKQRGPAQPHIRFSPDRFHKAVPVLLGSIVLQTSLLYRRDLPRRHIVNDLQGMGENLLMSLSVNCFYTFQLKEFREYIFQKSCLVHQTETHRRLVTDKDLVEFLDYPLLGQNGHPVFHRLHGLQGLRDNGETLLRGAELDREADSPKHPERIVAVSLFGLQWGPDYPRGKIPDPAERIYERPEILLLEAECHGVDREIATQLILLKGPVLNDRLAGVMPVGFLAGPDELYLGSVPFEHGGTESLEYRHIAMAMLILLDIGGHCLGELDPAAFDDDIDVIIAATEEAVPDISTDHEGPDTELLRGGGHYPENWTVKKSLCYRSAHIQSFPSIVSQVGKAFI